MADEHNYTAVAGEHEEMTSEGGTGSPTTGSGGLTVPLGVHFAELRASDTNCRIELREAELRFADERDRRYREVAAERERRHAEVDGLKEKALILQAQEYDRRLHALNGAYEEAQRRLDTYLPRETWEGWIKEEGARREKSDDAEDELRREVFAIRSETRATGATNNRNLALATLVLGLIVLLANGVLPGT